MDFDDRELAFAVIKEKINDWIIFSKEEVEAIKEADSVDDFMDDFEKANLLFDLETEFGIFNKLKKDVCFTWHKFSNIINSYTDLKKLAE